MSLFILIWFLTPLSAKCGGHQTYRLSRHERYATPNTFWSPFFSPGIIALCWWSLSQACSEWAGTFRLRCLHNTEFHVQPELICFATHLHVWQITFRRCMPASVTVLRQHCGSLFQQSIVVTLYTGHITPGYYPGIHSPEYQTRCAVQLNLTHPACPSPLMTTWPR